MRALSVLSSGLVCSIGLDARSACAALRCGIHGATETHFLGRGGEPILGCSVPLTEPLRGIDKLIKMAAPAVGECLRSPERLPSKEIPLLLVLPEEDRPGRPRGLDGEMIPRIAAELKAKFHKDSQVFALGRIGIAHALKRAEALIHEGKIAQCILAGVDSHLVGASLDAFDAKGRVLTSVNSDGFVPGEAAGALLVGATGSTKGDELTCRGLAFAVEEASIESEKPLRAEGLVRAVRGALADAGATTDDFDYRITDVSGPQYQFREAALAIGRVIRKVKPTLELWHPADCIGEVGAAIGPCMLAVALEAARKKYAPGPGLLCHLGNDDGRRAALLLRWTSKESRHG
jgi:3-oxoacyl-[acyl-carrier-protein] synthase-1